VLPFAPKKWQLDNGTCRSKGLPDPLSNDRDKDKVRGECRDITTVEQSYEAMTSNTPPNAKRLLISPYIPAIFSQPFSCHYV
jgi:hypothetical protein